jgi:hypothetical protein
MGGPENIDDSTASPVGEESTEGKKETRVSGKGTIAEQEWTIVVSCSSRRVHLNSANVK